MTDTPATASQTGATSPYPAPPARLRGLIASYFGLQFVVNFANGAVTQFMLPLSVDIADPTAKVANLGVIATVSAVSSLIMQPLAGWISDSTRSRWGRRAPWIVAGVTGTAVATGLFSLAASIPAIMVLALSLTVTYAAAAAPLFAVLADRTPPSARGAVSAIGGIGMWGGIVGGIVLGSAFVNTLSLGYLALAGFTLVAGIPLALTLRRDSSLLPRRERPTLRALVGQFWISPRRHPDFAWAFVARVVMYAGYTSLTAFLLYTLQDYLGLDRESAAGLVPVISLVAIATLLTSIYPAGRLSDRLDRRKPLVVVASLAMAATALIPVFVPTVPALIVTFAVMGLAFGAYISVDQALMTLVLPSSGDAGKDLGILNVASSAGQMLAPAIGSIAITVAWYPGMFIVAAALAALGAVAIVPIRSVR